MEFSELGLHQSLQKALDKLTFTKPTDVQVQTIPAVLAGKDIMVSAKTGSGKTAAFLLPMLHKFLNDPRPNTSDRKSVV